MTRRGRPRGSGYDDRSRIEAVADLMRTGLSRRAAILRTCGVDQLRRIEMKMKARTMADSGMGKIEALVRATLKGMGFAEEAIAGARLEIADTFTAEDVAHTPEHMRNFGYRIVLGDAPPATA